MRFDNLLRLSQLFSKLLLGQAPIPVGIVGGAISGCCRPAKGACNSGGAVGEGAGGVAGVWAGVDCAPAESVKTNHRMARKARK